MGSSAGRGGVILYEMLVKQDFMLQVICVTVLLLCCCSVVVPTYNDPVGGSEVESDAANLGSQEEDGVAHIRVKHLNNLLPVPRLVYRTVNTATLQVLQISDISVAVITGQ